MWLLIDRCLLTDRCLLIDRWLLIDTWLLTVQISFRLWWLCTKTFLWLVIIYSMLIVVCIYTYQFDGIRSIWHNATGLTTLQSVLSLPDTHSCP